MIQNEALKRCLLSELKWIHHAEINGKINEIFEIHILYLCIQTLPHKIKPLSKRASFALHERLPLHEGRSLTLHEALPLHEGRTLVLLPLSHEVLSLHEWRSLHINKLLSSHERISLDISVPRHRVHIF